MREKYELDTRLWREEDENDVRRLQGEEELAKKQRERTATGSQTTDPDLEVLRASALEELEVQLRGEHCELQQKYHDETGALRRECGTANTKAVTSEEITKELEAHLTFCRNTAAEKEEKWQNTRNQYEEMLELTKKQLMEKEQNLVKATCDLTKQVKQINRKSASPNPNCGRNMPNSVQRCKLWIPSLLPIPDWMPPCFYAMDRRLKL